MVQVKFQKPPELDSGPVWCAKYDSLEALVRSLEDYISKPLSEWMPQYGDDFHMLSTVAAPSLIDAFKAGTIDLPKGAEFKLKDDGFWSTL